jgi:exonuclease VII large subunit
MSVLRRGYAVLKDVPRGKPIRSVTELKTGNLVEAVLTDGSATAMIKDIKEA